MCLAVSAAWQKRNRFPLQRAKCSLFPQSAQYTKPENNPCLSAFVGRLDRTHILILPENRLFFVSVKKNGSLYVTIKNVTNDGH